MRSTTPPGKSGPLADDRTARARIRDAGIALVAERGAAALSARSVAAAAGVSAGLVIHHFGSMDALRAACDDHVVAVIRERKQAAFVAGVAFDVTAALREAGLKSMSAYLAAVLTEHSPAVDHLVDEMVSDAESYLERGVASGMLQPSTDPHGRAVVLTLWNLGSLAMHTHVKRLLGVDLTSPDFGIQAWTTAYMTPTLEIYGHGLFTPALAETLAASLPGEPAPAAPSTTPSPSAPTEGESG